jgi:hypothetical protein
LLRRAASRKSAAVKSSRVIAKAFGIKISPNHFRSEENHESERLRRAAESKASGCEEQLSQRSMPLVLKRNSNHSLIRPTQNPCDKRARLITAPILQTILK